MIVISHVAQNGLHGDMLFRSISSGTDYYTRVCVCVDTLEQRTQHYSTVPP